jgi:hypothetical protein
LLSSPTPYRRKLSHTSTCSTSNACRRYDSVTKMFDLFHLFDFERMSSIRQCDQNVPPKIEPNFVLSCLECYI